jgi:uncharacterized protein (TIGR00369 family)
VDTPALQDHYPDDFAHCYGCGRLNPAGLILRSRREGDAMVARFRPRPQDVAVPGFVYGGLLASLVDCHAMATAAAAVEERAGRAIGASPAPRFVTASLSIDYLRPTPHGPELLVRARALEVGDRKVIVKAEIEVEGAVTVCGRVVALRLPGTMAGR